MHRGGTWRTCIPAAFAALTPFGLSSKTRQVPRSVGGGVNLEKKFDVAGKYTFLIALDS